jgi:hypothetical protein
MLQTIHALFTNSKLFFFTSQLAYHETTYFLVRLLQEFTGFALEKSQNLQPPVEWAACEGLKGTEKVYPALHLTMYMKVTIFLGMHLKSMKFEIYVINLVFLSFFRVAFGYR